MGSGAAFLFDSQTLTMFISTFTYGLSGSVHCAFMCSPLSCYACSRNQKIDTRKIIAYHAARVLSYCAVGWILGVFSHMLAFKIYHNFENWVGVIFFGFLLFHFSFVTLNLYRPTKFGFQFIPFKWIETISRASPLSQEVSVGIITAMLPCGFLYGAFLQAVLHANPLQSMLSMFVFACATFPALFLGQATLSFVKKKSNKVVATTLLILVFLIALKGFITSLQRIHSPGTQTTDENCHQPRAHIF